MVLRNVEQNYKMTEIKNALKKYAQLVRTAKKLTTGTKMENDVSAMDYLIDFQTHVICKNIDSYNVILRY